MIMLCHPTRRQKRDCAGFTLIELMLASLLAAVLLVAVGAALRIELHFFDSGRREAEAAQLGRALIDRISEDVRQVVISPEIWTESLSTTVAMRGSSDEQQTFHNDILASAWLDPQRSADEEESSSSSSPSTTASVASERDGWNARTGLVGTRRSLRLDIRLADGKALESPTDDAELTEFQPIELPRTVHYELVPPNPTAGRAQISAIESSSATQVRDELTGLVRREIPLGRSPAEVDGFRAEGGINFEVETSTDPYATSDDPLERRDETGVRTNIVPEVADVMFRYSDGKLWSQSWDSRARGGLPVAVEVSLWFVRPETTESTQQNPTESDFTGTELVGLDESEPIEPPDYRVVISIPAAQAEGSASDDGAVGSLDGTP